MPKTATIRARTEPKLKKDVESIFKRLGVSSTEAINIFYRQVRLRKGIPFEIKVPIKTTLKAFSDSEKGKNLKTFKNPEDLFNDLEK